MSTNGVLCIRLHCLLAIGRDKDFEEALSALRGKKTRKRQEVVDFKWNVG